jgi:hypothetical protein
LNTLKGSTEVIELRDGVIAARHPSSSSIHA